MRYTIRACLIVFMLACCNGCMTQTVTRMTGGGAKTGTPVSSTTYWMWQPEFWQHK